MAARIGEQPYLNPAQREGFCSKVKTVAVIITQMATRVLFIVASILMAAAALPLKFHAMVIPAIAFGSTVLAGFFFPKPVHLAVAPTAELPPLVRPVAPRPVAPPVPPDLIQEAPRPLINISNNCWANSLVHFFNSDPLISQWFRNPLRDDMDMAAFEQFLAGYEPDNANFVPDPRDPGALSPREAYAQVIVKFREYVNNPANRREPIPAMFKTFLDNHVVLPNYARAFVDIKDTFSHLREFQETFANFFADYDQAMVENRAVGRSQELREALHRIGPFIIHPSAHVQMDPIEPLDLILDKLPNAHKIKMDLTYTFDTRGLPPLYQNPEGVIRKQEIMRLIQLPMKDWANPSVEQMLQYYCDEPEKLEMWYEYKKRKEYPANIVRKFVEAPSVLRFQIKRFVCEKAPYSLLNQPWLTRWFPKLGERPVKKENPVEVPENLTITLANGERKQYRLTSFVNHHGPSKDSGHYTAARIINGRKYLMSDQNVTLADPALWEERLRHPYFLCYIPVPA